MVIYRRDATPLSSAEQVIGVHILGHLRMCAGLWGPGPDGFNMKGQAGGRGGEQRLTLPFF